jgi:heme-degrading monooxygenase HmoA
MSEHVLVWQFRVREGQEEEFERTYGPRGPWAQLFARAEGYLGTELLRDQEVPRRYVTIDRWRDVASLEKFREQHREDYDLLDEQCDPLTEEELSLGEFAGWTFRE